MRIDKFLANSGIGTRSEVRKLIKNSKVKVFDKIVTDISYTVDEKVDIIKINDKIIEYRPYIYIMLNKPKGYISAKFDKKEKTVIDLLNAKYSTYDLFPVGRLDKDTEGLLILTNNGKLAHELLSPKKHISKKYYVELKDKISNEDKEKLEKGVNIGGYITKDDARVEILDNNSCYISISEGKFHQIKKMFKAVGNELIYLKRVSMNNLKLDDNLKLGEFRLLTDDELRLLSEKEK